MAKKLYNVRVLNLRSINGQRGERQNLFGSLASVTDQETGEKSAAEGNTIISFTAWSPKLSDILKASGGKGGVITFAADGLVPLTEEHALLANIENLAGADTELGQAQRKRRAQLFSGDSPKREFAGISVEQCSVLRHAPAAEAVKTKPVMADVDAMTEEDWAELDAATA